MRIAAHSVVQVANDIARGDVPTLALDLTETILKRFGQCNVADMEQFRDIVVKLASPAQRDYLHSVRKAMLHAREDQGRKLLWLYSFRDDYCLLYRFES